MIENISCSEYFKQYHDNAMMVSLWRTRPQLHW